jgi:hypothetical protein
LAPARIALEAVTRRVPVIGGFHQVVATSYPELAAGISVAGLFAILLLKRRAVVRAHGFTGFSIASLARGEWPLILGALMVGVLEWAAALSSAVHDRNYGIGILGGVTSLFAIFTGAAPASDQWDTWFVVGIPIGSAISAMMRRNLQLRSHEPGVLMVCFLGGLLTGAGASIGQGCFVGNTVTGLALLSVHSAVFTGCAVLANWATTVCYIKGLG